ncbi:alpha/beta hydrolase [Lewinella cohaerens]|uniref:alpha/beta hydrolase n=1 Tax=Lewinella cohaerens TaxID=70995 RepID=UPI00037F65D1|nr:alpha/beta hydrolase [Lewinella cohaerens]
MSAEFSWQTADGIKIYGIDWPCEKPLAVVGVIHGLGEHVHRYEHLVEYFHQHNIAVVGYDRRGHGRSGGKKGHTVSYKAFLDEIGQLAVEAEERYPNVPLFLYGHSMGGNLLLNYIIRRHPNIKGAIVTAPHIRLAFQPSAVMLTMGRVMKGVFPGFTQPNGLDVEQISRDKAEVEKYINDPYVHNKLTAITGMSMLEAAAVLDKYKGAFPVPLLLMHGGEDGITSPQGSEDFVGRITGDVTFKKWEGLYHEIHNEPEKEEVMAMIVNWINEMV